MRTSGVSEQTPDSELWRSVCQGSVLAFEVVVRRYQSLVCAVAYNACGDLALSEDVAQEALWAAWRQRESLAEPSRLSAWLCGIARNLGHNARRRGTPAVHTAPLGAAANVPDTGLGPAETAVSREEEALVWQALEQIPESYREPLILFYREQQSIAEVAAALDLSPDAVKQRLSRGRGMLQERVAQLVESALRRSRPGRPFTVAVVAGLTAISAGSKPALAAGGVVQAVGPFAAAGGLNGFLGGMLGALGGLLGAWLGVWVPSQLAPTKPESQYLWQRGKRMLAITILFTGLLAVPVCSFVARQISLPTYLMLLGAWFVGFWSYLAIEIVFVARGLKRIRGDAARAAPNDTPLRRKLKALTSRYRGRVFRSELSFLGLPLLDVNVSDPELAGRPTQRRAARGWIAVGDDAYGVLCALGGRAYGLIACGGRAVGLIAVGGTALGGFALGGSAAGIIAIGGASLGWQASGGGAAAWNLACGGGAVAWHAAYGGLAVAHDFAVGGAAWAAQVNTPAAEAAISGEPLAAAYIALLTTDIWLLPIFFPALFICLVPFLLLMYRRESGPGNPENRELEALR
jgi:zinc protease